MRRLGTVLGAALAPMLLVITSPLATPATPGWKEIVIGHSARGRPVTVLRLGSSSTDERPGVLVVGATDARQQFAAGLAEGMAQELAELARQDPTLLEDVTFYILPQPSPDATARVAATPQWESAANFTPTDDDRDGAVDEDGPEDLNGDGLITMMRVSDPAGGFIPHPLDARVLIAVKPENSEVAQYALYLEGVDNDEDERWNEDAPGGVDLNRNFPFDYPFFEPGAGEYQCCEPESQALANWLHQCNNIALVLTLGGGDNLYSIWPTGKDRGEVVMSLREGDEPYYKKIAEQYKGLVKREGEPPASDGRGSLLKWTYFHYGRWAIGVSPWWIEAEKKVPSATQDQKASSNPQQAKEQAAGTQDAAAAVAASATDAASSVPAEPVWDKQDKRGEYELRALEWLDLHSIDGFVDWTPVAHPDFPDKQVAVGGFKPYALLSPPQSELDGLATKHAQFAVALARMLPQPVLRDLKAEALGGGVYRVSTTVVNLGTLPTVSEMGEASRVPYPLQLTLELPPGATLVTGLARERLPRLAGGGGSIERSWLVNAPRGGSLGLKLYSPSVGSARDSIELSGVPR